MRIDGVVTSRFVVVFSDLVVVDALTRVIIAGVHPSLGCFRELRQISQGGEAVDLPTRGCPAVPKQKDGAVALGRAQEAV